MDIENQHRDGCFTTYFPPKSRRRYILGRGCGCLCVSYMVLMIMAIVYFSGVGIGKLIFQDNDPGFLWGVGPLIGSLIIFECSLLTIVGSFILISCIVCVGLDMSVYMK